MSAGDVNVEVSTQKIIVEPATSSVSVIKAGPQGPTGIPGVGSGGAGAPSGGVEGEVLRKNSGTDYDFSWGGALPSGFLGATFSSTQPAGWFFDNQTITNCESLYPGLWAATPTAWRSGSDLVIPDLSDRVMLFTQGATGVEAGAMAVGIGVNNLPQHTHAAGTLGMSGSDGTHSHTAGSAGDSPGHVHYLTTDVNGSGGSGVGGWSPSWDMWGMSSSHVHSANVGSDYLYRDTAYNTGWMATNSAPGGPPAITWNAYTYWASADHDHAFAAWGHTSGAHQQHTHGISVYTTNSGHGHTITGSTGNNTTTGTNVDITPAHVTVRAIIKI